MIQYIVRPLNSPLWHDAKPCVSFHLKQPLLHWCTREGGAVLCSALDDHDVIVIDTRDNYAVSHHSISAREHFDQEDLEASNA